MMLTKGDIKKIDRMVDEGLFASRADFGVKAVFLLLASMDGVTNEIKSGAPKEKSPADDFI